jgi:hypothetical protein
VERRAPKAKRPIAGNLESLSRQLFSLVFIGSRISEPVILILSNLRQQINPEDHTDGFNFASAAISNQSPVSEMDSHQA